MLADHIRAQTPALIAAWRAAVVADPLCTTGDSLPRGQLEDHLPVWLAAFADILAAAPRAHDLQRFRGAMPPRPTACSAGSRATTCTR